MTEFKEFIQNDFQNTTEMENNLEDFQKSMKDKTIKEEENEIQTLEVIEDNDLDDNSDDLMTKMCEIESKQSKTKIIESIQTEDYFQNDEIEDFDDMSSIGSDFNNEILQEESDFQELEKS